MTALHEQRREPTAGNGDRVSARARAVNVADLRRAVADRPCCAAAPELEFLEDIKNEFAILFKLNHSFSRSVIRDLVGVLHFSHEILVIVALNAVEWLLLVIGAIGLDADAAANFQCNFELIVKKFDKI